MKIEPAKSDAQNSFSEAFGKLVSIPRAEMQKRLEFAPKEAVSRHRRYKYVPAMPPQKP